MYLCMDLLNTGFPQTAIVSWPINRIVYEMKTKMKLLAWQRDYIIQQFLYLNLYRFQDYFKTFYFNFFCWFYCGERPVFGEVRLKEFKGIYFDEFRGESMRTSTK